MLPFPSWGLYAIADSQLLAGRDLQAAVKGAILGGARIIQYRDKRQEDAARRQQEAALLLEVCRTHGVPLIVNDDLALASDLGADGVHLGKDDPPLALARRLLGPQATIGISCYDSLERALAAEQHGANYVAFGRFFPSRSKPHAGGADPALLRAAHARLGLPIVAIGGITPANGAVLLQAGASLLAVIHGVFGQADPEAAARRYMPLWAHLSGHGA